MANEDEARLVETLREQNSLKSMGIPADVMAPNKAFISGFDETGANAIKAALETHHKGIGTVLPVDGAPGKFEVMVSPKNITLLDAAEAVPVIKFEAKLQEYGQNLREQFQKEGMSAEAIERNVQHNIEGKRRDLGGAPDRVEVLDQLNKSFDEQGVSVRAGSMASVVPQEKRLEQALGVPVQARETADGKMYTLQVPQEPDAQGRIINAMGVANQLTKAMDLPDGAIVLTGGGNVMTRDIAIPAERVEEVIQKANDLNRAQPGKLKEVIPEETRRETTQAPARSERATSEIPSETKAAPAPAKDSGQAPGAPGRNDAFEAALKTYEALVERDAVKNGISPDKVASHVERNVNMQRRAFGGAPDGAEVLTRMNQELRSQLGESPSAPDKPKAPESSKRTENVPSAAATMADAMVNRDFQQMRSDDTLAMLDRTNRELEANLKKPPSGKQPLTAEELIAATNGATERTQAASERAAKIMEKHQRDTSSPSMGGEGQNNSATRSRVEAQMAAANPSRNDSREGPAAGKATTQAGARAEVATGPNQETAGKVAAAAKENPKLNSPQQGPERYASAGADRSRAGQFSPTQVGGAAGQTKGGGQGLG